jgi:[protein-PII] uridylyltransferase
MEILRQPTGITTQLRRMNRYGLLAAYLPSFGLIVGRMQYDLFHVYTVDEHILMVLRNVRRTSVKQYEHEHPLSSRIFKQLPKPELIYLAALFHDIAKGRDGDHSILGAVEAEQFCQEHGLSDYDAKLVAWLVRHHLVMSMTAQQRDISDPDVVYEFAKLIGNKNRLDYLYILTVADIRGTNPEIWNSWKASLLASLYEQTKQVLRRGLDNPAEHEEIIAATQDDAMGLLKTQGMPAELIQSVWNDFETDYFLRYNAEDIARHTLLINAISVEALPLVKARFVERTGSTELFIYHRDSIDLFFRITRTLDQMGMNILDARIMSTRSGMAIDTLQIHDANENPIIERDRLEQLEQRLVAGLTSDEAISSEPEGQISRQHKHFNVSTRINYYPDEAPGMTAMELSTHDRRGLLSRVAQVLKAHRIRLHTARIATIGEEADDMLYITDELDQALTPAAEENLQRELTEALDQSQ